jgi:hypothetical protein
MPSYTSTNAFVDQFNFLWHRAAASIPGDEMPIRELSKKARIRRDILRVFARRLPRGVLLGVGVPHGEGVFFGVLSGLPFNVFVYYWLTIQFIKRFFPDKVKAK